MRHGESWINCDRTLKKWHGGHRTSRTVNLPSRGVGLQSLQGRCRRFRERRIAIGTSGERFAGPRPELPRKFRDRIQDLLFLCCSHLLIVNDLVGSATLCPQAHYVLSSETCYRSLQNGRASGPLADFARKRRTQRRVNGLPHEPQCLSDPLIRDQTEKRRLLQLHRQALPECPIENGVTRLIHKLSKHDRVFIGEFRTGMKPKRAGNNSHRSYGDRHERNSNRCEPVSNSRSSPRNQGLRILFQPFEVGVEVGSARVPALPIL